MSGHIKITNRKERTRWRRKHSIRKRVTGTTERPRLSVFRSNAHIYVQAIDDSTQKVLAAASDLEAAIKDSLTGKKKAEKARLIGQAIGKRLKEQNITRVVFDRNGFIYHGRVQQVAEGAREAGLEF